MDLNPTTVAVPLALVAILTFIMQYLKPVLEAHVPGFSIDDASHDFDLRIAYWALAFGALMGYVLATMAHPTTVDGWLLLNYAVGNTAALVTGGGHVVYKKISMQSKGRVTPLEPADVSYDPPAYVPEAVSQPSPVA